MNVTACIISAAHQSGMTACRISCTHSIYRKPALNDLKNVCSVWQKNIPSDTKQQSSGLLPGELHLFSSQGLKSLWVFLARHREDTVLRRALRYCWAFQLHFVFTLCFFLFYTALPPKKRPHYLFRRWGKYSLGVSCLLLLFLLSFVIAASDLQRRPPSLFLWSLCHCP